MGRNPKELVLDHVLFEFEMYLFAVVPLGNNIYSDASIPEYVKQLQRNLYWEEELTHLRNLLLFFVDKASFQTDIIYTDIVAQDPFLGTPIKEEGNIKKAINKTTSHLTYDRIEPSWEADVLRLVQSARTQIVRKIELFTNQLISGAVHDHIYTGRTVSFSDELAEPHIVALLDTIINLLKACSASSFKGSANSSSGFNATSSNQFTNTSQVIAQPSSAFFDIQR